MVVEGLLLAPAAPAARLPAKLFPIKPFASAQFTLEQVAPQPGTDGQTERQDQRAEALPRLRFTRPTDANRSPNNPFARPANPASSSEQAPFKYRLIVQGSSDWLLQQVRRIAPDAFRTFFAGQRVIQAGLFVERDTAVAVQQQLSPLNIATSILDITPASTPGSSDSGSSSFKYRLIVQGSSDWLLQQVRQITPDAFRSYIAGQRVIQAGLFVERQIAEAVQQQLSSLNVTTNILDINYGTDGIRAGAPRLPMSLAVPQRDGRVLVVVDPGHGGGDPGAVGIGNIHEATIVLDIAQQVSSLLEKRGIQAVLTRQDDREIDLQPRVNLAESLRADLFVSIHANSIDLTRPDINGIETYYYSSGTSLASAIHNSLVNATGMTDRGIHQARFYVLTQTTMPAVLVEVGFVTGQEDVLKLNSPTWRSQIAAGIAQGILRYVQQRL